jgi:hypothetical protein
MKEHFPLGVNEKQQNKTYTKSVFETSDYSVRYTPTKQTRLNN